MQSENDFHDKFDEFVKENSEYEDLPKRFFITQLPYLLVTYNLDNLFLEDNLQALHKLREINLESQLNKLDWIVIDNDFQIIKKKILARLQHFNDFDEAEKIMMLLYSMASFESMVNYHLEAELSIKDFSSSDMKKIYKISLEEKLGWLLKLTCGNRYTEKENWKSLKKFVEARNFFIHSKPIAADAYYTQSSILTVDSFNEFLNAASDCHSFLMGCHTDACKNKFSRIERIENFLHEKYPEYSTDTGLKIIKLNGLKKE